MPVKFRFKNDLLIQEVLELESRAEIIKQTAKRKPEKTALQFLYGNLIEMANVKMEKLCRMDIPKDHKEIAVKIRNEEVGKILAEFNQRIQDEGLAVKNCIGNLEWI